MIIFISLDECKSKSVRVRVFFFVIITLTKKKPQLYLYEKLQLVAFDYFVIHNGVITFFFHLY